MGGKPPPLPAARLPCYTPPMPDRPDIRLLDDGDAPADALSADVPFAGERLGVAVTVPPGRARLADVVGVARGLCDRFTEVVIRRAAEAGAAVSCFKGCAACCTSFLVPVTVPEAFRLLEDLRELPPGRRRRIEVALAAGTRKIEHADLAEALAGLDPADPAARTRQVDLAGEWWSRERFTCPLLRAADGACGPYAHRPIPCREFLAVSDPALCAENRETRLRRPFAMHAVLSAWAARMEGTRPTLILLPNLLAWLGDHPLRPRRTWPARELVDAFLATLTEIATRSAPQFAGVLPSA